MRHRWRLLVLLVTVATIALLRLPLNDARSADAPPSLGTVTVEASKEGELKQQINKFVSGGLVTTYPNESLERWNTPICPLVVGIAAAPADFIRARLAHIAKDSGAPFAAGHCKPNMYVVITNDPDLLLDKWHKRTRGLFNDCDGLGPIKAFLHSSQPVRVFYNATFASPRAPGIGALSLAGLKMRTPTTDCLGSGATDSWLHYGVVHELTSVIIVLDGRKATNLSVRQLADYFAMVGLAQIRVQPDTGATPSILHLFQESKPQTPGLSPWDQALLRSLYATDQTSVLEVALIQDGMYKQLAGL